MAGLMDFMGGMFGGGDVYGDLLTEEQKKAMQQQTMMTMAAKLLQAGGPSTTPTNLGQALGGAFLTGQEAYQKAGANALTQMLTKQKIDEYKRAQATQKLMQGILMGNQPQQAPGQMATPSPGQMATPSPDQIQLGETPQMSMPGMMQQAPSTQQGAAPLNQAQQLIARLSQAGQAIMAVDPKQGAQLINSAKALQEMSMQGPAKDLSANEIAALGLPLGTIAQRTADNQVKVIRAPDLAPNDIRLLEGVGMQPTWDNLLKLKKASGTSITNVQSVADKALAGAVGGDVQKEMRMATDMARAAQSSLSNIALIRQNTDQAILGPGADMRTWMTRAATVLGVGGENAEEVLAKTRSVLQGMAREELTAAQSMKGQGPLTDNERAILRKAALGDQSMTAPELNVAMNAMEKIAKEKIKIHSNLLSQFSTLPGMSQFLPFYSIGGSIDDALAAEMRKRGL